MRTETFDTPGQVSLVVKVQSGAIELETTDGTTTQVEVEGPHAEDFRIESRERGGRVEVVVEAPKRFTFSGGDHLVSIRAPHEADLEVRTGSGSVDARGRYGEVEILSGSGDVAVEQVAALAVKAGSGEIEIGRVEGRLSATTGSGDVEIGRLGGEGSLRTGSGEVTIGEANSDLTIMTGSGDQTVGSAASGRLKLRAASGDVHVGIRRGSRVFVDARSASGDMESELDLEGEAPPGDGPMVEVDAATASGDVRIVRA
jgi:DUF4097 and DUF4098 domain-containing protein YvlB